MFGISFSEMFVIALVCLVIVGPQRLPSMARFCGHLLGRVQRQATALKREIRKEMELEDLRQLKREAEETASEVQQVASEAVRISDKPSGPERQG